MNSLGKLLSEKCKVLLYNYNSLGHKRDKGGRNLEILTFVQFSCNFSKFTCFYKCSTVWAIDGLFKQFIYVSYFKKWLKRIPNWILFDLFLGFQIVCPEKFWKWIGKIVKRLYFFSFFDKRLLGSEICRQIFFWGKMVGAIPCKINYIMSGLSIFFKSTSSSLFTGGTYY